MKSIQSYVNERNEDIKRAYEEFDTEQCREMIEKDLDMKPEMVKVKKDRAIDECAEVFVNYTRPEDYPHGLMQNSCLFRFYYSFPSGVLELMSAPHMYLSPYDREHGYKYMAMRSATDLAKECGVAKFRKTHVKDMKDLAAKITKYVNLVMPIVDCYTGGYPYHQSELTVSIADAYKK